MQFLPAATIVLSMTTGLAHADEHNSFTDKDGAQYTILFERPFSKKLKAQMIEIINDDTAMLIEMGLDCLNEQYIYLGMTFDLPVNAAREDEAAKVMSLFDMGCGRG